MAVIPVLMFLVYGFQYGHTSDIQQFRSSEHASTQGDSIYIHFDRQLYVTGDRLWYKAYVIGKGNQDLFSESRVLYVELFNQQQERVTQQILYLDRGQANGDIFFADTLPSGIYFFAAYTSLMRLEVPCNIYWKPILIYNRFETKTSNVTGDFPGYGTGSRKAGILSHSNAHAEIKGIRDIYKTRDKVDINVMITKGSLPAESSFSVSVAKVPPVVLSANHTASSGPQDFDLSEFSDSGQRLQLEKRGNNITGQVLWKHNGSPVAHKRLILAIPDSISILDYALTDHQGWFSFILDKYYSSDQLFLHFEDQLPPADSIRIRWLSKFIDTVCLPRNTFHLPPVEQGYLLSQRNRISIGNAYGISTEVLVDGSVERDQDSHIPFYGMPAIVVFPEEYLSLPNLKEITRELLPSIRFTGQPGHYSLDIYNPVTQGYMAQSFILLDGVPVYDFNLVAELGSSDIQRIEVQNRTRVFGDIILDGVVALFTKEKRIHAMDLSKSHLKYHFPKFKQPALPIMPVYEDNADDNSRIPDFRQLLYWGPMNRTGRDGKGKLSFFTSDETGWFRITVEGITLDGLYFTNQKDLYVGNQR